MSDHEEEYPCGCIVHLEPHPELPECPIEYIPVYKCEAHDSPL